MPGGVESALLTDLKGFLDGVEALLTTLNGLVDALEGSVDGLEGSVDGLEGLVDGLETSLTTIAGHLDGVEGSLTTIATNTTAATVSSIAQTSALDNDLVVKASAGTLRGFVGYTTTAQFIQVHDASSTPADTAVPELVFPIEADKPFSIVVPGGAHLCGTGIVICNSTTGPTKTIGAANTWITAYYV